MQALQLAEQLHGGNDQTPQVGVVLGLLGHVYARSKRITLAEGLHRYGLHNNLQSILIMCTACCRHLEPMCQNASEPGLRCCKLPSCI